MSEPKPASLAAGNSDNKQPKKVLRGFVGRVEEVDNFKTDPWTPNGKGIAFLTDQVLRQSEFVSREFPECRYYRGTFFKDLKDFETIIEVRLYNEGEFSLGGSPSPVGRASRPFFAIYGHGMQKGNGQTSFDNQDIKAVSKFLRNSFSLRREDGYVISESLIFPDKSGIGIIAPTEPSTGQIERYLICLMYLVACEEVLTRTSLNLSSIVAKDGNAEEVDELLNRYRDFLSFIYSSFTVFPVRRESVAVYEVWEKLKDHNRLAEIYGEADHQLSALAKFFQADESRKLIQIQNEIIDSENKRAQLEAEERKIAQRAREKNEVFQRKSAKRQALGGGLIAFFGLLIAVISIPDPIRLELCSRYVPTKVAAASAVELLCAGQK